MQAGGSPHLENYRCQCEFLQIKAQPRLGVAGGGPHRQPPVPAGGREHSQLEIHSEEAGVGTA